LSLSPAREGQSRPPALLRASSACSRSRDLVTTAAQTLDYQFGFKVSGLGLSGVKASPRWMFLLQLTALLLSTCVVYRPGERALLERFGKRVEGRAVLDRCALQTALAGGQNLPLPPERFKLSPWASRRTGP
jgi:hypothetical protein